MECLKREGVDTIFGYPGGAVIPIYDTLTQYPEIKHVLVRHEQGAGHMAEGYALATGKVGVCLATSGPGATNLVTPLTDAMMDSRPPGRHHRPGQDLRHRHRRLPGGRHHRHHHAHHQAQLADPRRDQAAGDRRRGVPHRPLGPPRPRPDRHPARHRRGQVRVHAGRGGRDPDLQADRSRATSGRSRRPPSSSPRPSGPILYVGGGAIYSGAEQEIAELAERIDTPVTTTLKGLGAFPETHPLSLGMLGMHGTAYANYAVSANATC